MTKRDESKQQRQAAKSRLEQRTNNHTAVESALGLCVRGTATASSSHGLISLASSARATVLPSIVSQAALPVATPAALPLAPLAAVNLAPPVITPVAPPPPPAAPTPPVAPTPPAVGAPINVDALLTRVHAEKARKRKHKADMMDKEIRKLQLIKDILERNPNFNFDDVADNEDDDDAADEQAL